MNDYEVNSAPGRSVYLIGFWVDNFHYLWSAEHSGFYNEVTGVIFSSLPVGAYGLEWSLHDPDKENNNV